MWCGHNFTDDGSQLEKLAIRFKNTELAQKFYGVAQECIAVSKPPPPPPQDNDQDYEGVSTEEEEYDNEDDER